ncbi:hypothetical protein C8Q75DRAFT_752365 [Abortiporus biennis]|nr:hypothetical protein C8Q75DRAFT_752365 [Abortiporus biennis]
MSGFPPFKRQRRTATSVLAGNFDPRSSRDVLTSLLNGVPIYKEVEGEEEDLRRAKKMEKKEKEKEKKKAKEREKEKDTKRASLSVKPKDKGLAVASTSNSASAPPNANAARPIVTPRPVTTVSPFWVTRPIVHIPNVQRSVSVTPPPMPSSPPTTPGPSISSRTSATSSKRPRTPDDDIDYSVRGRSASSSTPPPNRPRKKRVAVRKGWKGWVEGSPPPSEKLINLDVVTVLNERKTRSGKNFDAIGVGKDSWV